MEALRTLPALRLNSHRGGTGITYYLDGAMLADTDILSRIRANDLQEIRVLRGADAVPVTGSGTVVLLTMRKGGDDP